MRQFLSKISPKRFTKETIAEKDRKTHKQKNKTIGVGRFEETTLARS